MLSFTMIPFKKYFPPFLFSSLFFLVFFGLFGFKLADDEAVNKLLARFQQYIQALPQEKIYLHIDKPYYVAGEPIWYKAYLVNAQTHQPDTLSKVAYVELVSPEGQTLTKQVLKLTTGAAAGDLDLPDSLAAGTYQLRAYTNWMRNLPADFLFEQTVSIYNNSQGSKSAAKKPRSRNIPQTNNSSGPALDVQFFPEGGNLVAGFFTRIGFKAINRAGKGEDITGVITDETGKELSTFKSARLGMGHLLFMPEAGKKYLAKVKTSTGQEFIVSLPTVLNQGFSMQVNSFFKDKIQVTIRQNIASGDAGKEVILVGQTRGNLFYAAKAKASGENLLFNIPKDKIPTGVAQFTLLDKTTQLPICERLAFINQPSEQLQLTIKPNKTTYKAREAVTLDISAVNAAGQPISTNLSLAVTDGALYDESPGQNMATYLLLASDLRGNIEKPAYYFQNQNPETVQALDNLMLTQGWRRFTWQEALADTLKMPRFYPENSISISGQVNRLINNKPLPNAEVVMLATGKQRFIAQAKTDDKGRFNITGFDFDSTLSVVVTAKNQKGKPNTAIILDKVSSPPLRMLLPAGTPEEISPFTANYITRIKDQQKIEDAYLNGNGGKLLKVVDVKAKREPKPENRRIFGTADNVIKLGDKAVTYTNILQALQGTVAGLQVTGGGADMTVSIRGGGTPLFLLDDMPVEMDLVSSIDPNSVETIEVLKGASAAIYGGRGGNGVIAIYTKRGENAFASDPVGIINNKVQGYYKAREFYAPKYDVKKEEHNLPDRRSTLHWQPFVKTDTNGKATVSFYNADEVTKMQIILEGISANGLVGSLTMVVGKP